MPTRIIKFTEGNYYHLYNRGNSKQAIFHDKEDHERFVGLLHLCNDTKRFEIRSLDQKLDFFVRNIEKRLVDIGFYCLMPNHFHIALKPVEDGGVSIFMQKLGTAYSMYYNKKYKRTGGLFEGKFKAKHIDSDRYFKYLYAYIHLNPVKLIDPKWKEDGPRDKARIVRFLSEYEYSSYFDYLGIPRKEEIVLNTKTFPEYFADSDSFIKNIMEWISYADRA